MHALVMQYMIYCTRGVVSYPIKHLASPHALLATRTLLSCCKSRTALHTRINYNLIHKHMLKIRSGYMIKPLRTVAEAPFK